LEEDEMSELEVKEKPILFSAPMVRAILDRSKTQTRRVIKPQPAICPHNGLYLDWAKLGSGVSCDRVALALYSPYGQIGDRLWVRETWNAWMHGIDDCDPYLWSDITPEDRKIATYGKIGYQATDAPLDPDVKSLWVPSIHMPRWASRITLEITDIRIERLQDISEEDAKAEGCKASEVVELIDGSPCFTSEYRKLWDSINGIDNPKSWESNPWVWVVSFKRLP
jgi:hypothetical protein